MTRAAVKNHVLRWLNVQRGDFYTRKDSVPEDAKHCLLPLYVVACEVSRWQNGRVYVDFASVMCADVVYSGFDLVAFLGYYRRT